MPRARARARVRYHGLSGQYGIRAIQGGHKGTVSTGTIGMRAIGMANYRISRYRRFAHKRDPPLSAMSRAMQVGFRLRFAISRKTIEESLSFGEFSACRGRIARIGRESVTSARVTIA